MAYQCTDCHGTTFVIDKDNFDKSPGDTYRGIFQTPRWVDVLDNPARTRGVLTEVLPVGFSR